MARLKAVKKSFCTVSVFVLVILGGFVNGQNQALDKTQLAAETTEEYQILKRTIAMLKKNPERIREALEIFAEIYPSDSNNALLNLRLGAAYFKLNMIEKGVYHINKAAQLNIKVHNDLFFYQGWCLQLKNNFKQAEKKFNDFKKYTTPESEELNFEIDQRIRECKSGDSLFTHPANVTITNLGKKINTKFAEITPIVNADETSLFFTSRKFNYETQDYYEKIFSSKKKSGVWGRPLHVQFSEDMEVHEAISGLFPDGLAMLVYQGDVHKGDIFYSSYSNGKWSELKDLGKNINTSHHESSACLSPQGSTLYFVSNRPGGMGGRDIYYSNYDNSKNSWGPAINIGPPINTPFDEEGVFLHPGGRLMYFASKGHAGMGGYDIYYSELKGTQNESGNWQMPVNAGYPVNTTRDNVYASLSADGKRVYFSSQSKEGIGEKDIYCATFNKRPPVQPKMVLLTGSLKTETNSPLNATIDLFDLQKDTKVGSYKTDALTGKYTIPLPGGKKYGIVMYSDGYLFESENIDVSDTASYKHFTRQKKLKKMQAGKSTLLNNLFFGKGKSEPLPESMNELKRVYDLLKRYNKLKVEIAGYSDNIGSDEFNIKLSSLRAKSVYDYLIGKGIKESQLSYSGYGKVNPIANNTTEEGRSLNRRIEFKIIEM